MKGIVVLFLFLNVILWAQIDTQQIAEFEKESKGKWLRTSTEAHPDGLFTVNDNSGYDVQHYTIEINANPDTPLFSGTTTIEFTTLNSLHTIELDAKNNLTITSVTYQGAPITNYTHTANKLSINFPSTLASGVTTSVSVSYTGSADTSSGYYLQYHGSTPIISTLSESFHARAWYICKDGLTDKSDNGVDMYITHPNTYKAASNGVLISETAIDANTTKTHWDHNYPIVPYLVSICVTNYVEYNSSVTLGGQTIPIINYIYPESNTSFNHNLLDDTPDYMQFMYDTFGPYPYELEKYGHAQWEWGGGMEHATMSSMVNFSRNLNMHELAHQWFGDKITCGTWQDIWLNEGFATYCSGLIVEHQDGEQAWDNWKNSYINIIVGNSSGSVYINNPADALNESRIFNFRLSYAKGAMVLHMLRFLMGDTAFYQAVQNYLNDANLAYDFAITPQFQSHLESEYGASLQEFFNDWVYGEGHPIFDLTLNLLSASSGDLVVSQSSSHPSVGFFETPFEVSLFGANGEVHTERFFLSSNNQNFSIADVGFPITSYTFNPHADIIAVVNSQTLSNVDIQADKEMMLYPNPATDILTVIAPNHTILSLEVYDEAGKLVLYQNDAVEETTSLRVEGWVKGVYEIVVELDNKTIKDRLIKR